MKGIILIFRLPEKKKNTELSKFCKLFYGQDTSSHKGKYRYHRHGLLDDISYRKLLRGVIIIKNQDLGTILKFLNKYSAEVQVREIKLTEEDCQLIGISQK